MDRRLFATSATALALLPLSPVFAQPHATLQNNAGSLTDVPGLRVGHFADSRRPMGCTVSRRASGRGSIGSDTGHGMTHTKY